MPSDVEMSDSGRSSSEPTTLPAYKQGPEQLKHRGVLYTRKDHEDQTRAYTKSSIIWQFGDEYEKGGEDGRPPVKTWRCGICKKTVLLVMKDNSSSGLRHLRNKHKIDKTGASPQSTIAAAFTAVNAVASLVAGFKASTFRYLLIRWIVTMHIALTYVESKSFRAWVLYVAPALDKDLSLFY